MARIFVDDLLCLHFLLTLTLNENGGPGQRLDLVGAIYEKRHFEQISCKIVAFLPD
jgi:hypothetical protein